MSANPFVITFSIYFIFILIFILIRVSFYRQRGTYTTRMVGVIRSAQGPGRDRFGIAEDRYRISDHSMRRHEKTRKQLYRVGPDVALPTANKTRCKSNENGLMGRFNVGEGDDNGVVVVCVACGFAKHCGIITSAQCMQRDRVSGGG